MDTAGIRATAYLSAVLLLCNFNGLNYCSGISNVTRTQKVPVGETLISPGQVFELGFFSPGSSSNQYVGIWYKNISVRKAIWVANREKPLTAADTSASLVIGSDGNLLILDGTNISMWSTNLSVGASEAVAVLLDNGDLVLKDGTSGEILWESFQFPGDTFLPGMKLGVNTITGERRFLSSWQTEDNPLPGLFSVGIVPESPAQAFVWKESTPYWRTGPWNGLKFFGLPNTAAANLNGFSFLIDKNLGSAYFSITISSSSLVRIVVISPVGALKVLDWDEGTKKWNQWWQEPQSSCDVYGTCGAFGVCNQSRSPICRCMKGFVPKSNEEWRRGNWKGGCVRRTQLQCEENESHTSLESGKNDGFWQLSGLKLPDFPIYLNLDDATRCGIWCLNNCSCVAYASIEQINCIVWVGDLLDVQESSLISAESLFLRLAKSELGNVKPKSKYIVSFSLISALIFFGAIVCGYCRCRANQRGRNSGKWKPRIWSLKQVELISVVDLINNSRDSPQRSLNINMSRQDSSELYMFEFYKIAAATNNFSMQNKVGEGGFGPVFKGVLQDGQEIAVKRLSTLSGQGTEEFKNEIRLISKLQHRNLVRIMGCCIEGAELLIIYEYMSNKSLDNFLFDATERAQLDWPKRFKIILGIARGLLYLHHDSCLKIIHRDLKASNILLDKDMNPKISDFGVARSFRETQVLANTRRVVGTFGYMSPEYITRGVFSEKSDVFSFGVLLLEILSSKKNTGFDNHGEHLNLLGYAWHLWSEGRGLELIDQLLAPSLSPVEKMRCLHVGLLCVQDNAIDRPTMSTVLSMLTGEADRPHPKRLSVTFGGNSDGNGESQNRITSSRIDVTISMVEGR